METTSRATVLPIASRYTGTSCATASVTETGAGGRSNACCAALLTQPEVKKTARITRNIKGKRDHTLPFVIEITSYDPFWRNELSPTAASDRKRAYEITCKV